MQCHGGVNITLFFRDNIEVDKFESEKSETLQ